MSRGRLQWIALLGFTVPCTPVMAANLSGTYIAQGHSAAFLIQMVETADGHVTGRYEQVTLRPDGKLEDMNAAINGAADGDTLAVTIKPAEFLSGSIAASGTLQGQMLHLTGGGNGTSLILNMVKSDEGTFRAQVVELSNQSRRIDAERRQREFAERQAVDKAKLLETLTTLRQRMLNSGQLAREIVEPAQTCHRAHVLTDADPVSASEADVNDACLRFYGAGKTFEQKVSSLRSAFASIEGVWTAERREQEQLVEASSQAAY